MARVLLNAPRGERDEGDLNRCILFVGGMAWLVSGCSLLVSTEGLSGTPGALSSGEDGGAITADAAGAGDASAPASPSDSADAGNAVVSPDASSSVPAGDDSGARVDAGAPDTSTIPTTPTAIYSDLVAPLGIAVNAGTLCWTGGGALRGVFCAPAVGGSAADVRTIAVQTTDALAAGAFDVALDSENVYWSNGPNVIRKPLSGGASASFFNGLRLSYLASQGDPSDGGTQIWASDYALPDSGAEGDDILVGPIAQGTSEYLYEGETGAAGVAVYEDTVFWGRTASPGYVCFGPKGGKTTSTPIETAGPVTGVAVDRNGTLYFLVSDQTVYRLALGATSPDLAYDAGAPLGGGDLAVDDDAVYLSEHDRGVIMRLPK